WATHTTHSSSTRSGRRSAPTTFSGSRARACCWPGCCWCASSARAPPCDDLGQRPAATMIRALDVLLAGAVVALGSLLLAIAGCASRAVRRYGASHRPFRNSAQSRPRRIVYLGTGQIAQVFPRNGVNLFLERECSDFGGYFEQMWNVHFPAGTRGKLDLSPRHHLIDVDFPTNPQLPMSGMVWRELRFLL